MRCSSFPISYELCKEMVHNYENTDKYISYQELAECKHTIKMQEDPIYLGEFLIIMGCTIFAFFLLGKILWKVFK